MWICPECNRKFSKNKQSHSCIKYDIEELLKGKGKLTRELFNYLIVKLQEFGEFEVYIGKFNVTLRNLSTFASVMLERQHLTIVFLSHEPIDEFPVYQNYHYSANRWSNAVKVENINEIDDQLLGWLKKSWLLTQ